MTTTKHFRFLYSVVLYHDGIKVNVLKKWYGDELNDCIDDLEANGYTKGYTKDEVDAAEMKFKRMRDNLIGGEQKYELY